MAIPSFHTATCSLYAYQITPILIECFGVHICDNARWLPVEVGRLVNVTILEFDFQGHSFDLDSVAPAQCNRAGQRIMLEVDQIFGQSVTGFAVFLLVTV